MAGAVTLILALTAPIAEAASPSAFVYAAGSSSSVYPFAADDAGLLSQLTPSVSGTGAETGAAVSPDGRDLYVVSQGADNVSHYRIGHDGTLTAIAQDTVSTGNAPFGIAIAPDGRHAYVANQTPGAVTIYDVGADGALTAHADMVAARSGSIQVALTPDGASAYVTNFTDGTISQYDVGADGTLTPKSTPYVNAGMSPLGIAVSPDGDSLYAVNRTADGTVQQYSIGADGSLSEKVPAFVPSGSRSVGVAVGSHGVYVTNYNEDSISTYGVAADGTLTPKSVVGAAHNPFGLALAPDGDSLYVAAFGAGVVEQYDVAGDGALTAKSPRSAEIGSPLVALAVARPRDEQAPTIDLRTPADGAAYDLGEAVVADYSCDDEGGAGLKSCTGDVADGEALDTATPGEHAFTVVARDGEGNETTVSHSYTVTDALRFEGFVGPIHDGSVVRPGSDVEIRFSLGGFRGDDVLADGSPSSVRVDCDDPGEPTGGRPAASDAGLQFDDATGTYSFVWQTQRSWARTCRAFVLTLRDGSVHRLVLSLRSWGWDHDHSSHRSSYWKH